MIICQNERFHSNKLELAEQKSRRPNDNKDHQYGWTSGIRGWNHAFATWVAVNSSETSVSKSRTTKGDFSPI